MNTNEKMNISTFRTLPSSNDPFTSRLKEATSEIELRKGSQLPDIISQNEIILK